jgi:hypothetical protein
MKLNTKLFINSANLLLLVFIMAVKEKTMPIETTVVQNM